jgi:pyruvate formate lyase activating enzyme
MSGKYCSVDELMEIVEKERPFFDQSGGGVTLSGGEPLLYPDFVVELLRACGEQQIHRAIDTSGYVEREVLLRAAEHTELFLYDLKMIDAAKHKSYTGVDNALILENLQVLSEAGAAIQVRIPLVGGVNDDQESVREAAAFVAGLTGEKKEVNLLPFHDVARGKDEKLGQGRDLSGLAEPNQEVVASAVDILNAYGLCVKVGG